VVSNGTIGGAVLLNSHLAPLLHLLQEGHVVGGQVAVARNQPTRQHQQVLERLYETHTEFIVKSRLCVCGVCVPWCVRWCVCCDARTLGNLSKIHTVVSSYWCIIFGGTFSAWPRFDDDDDDDTVR